ncbi:MAG TPA: glycosyltransferase family 4 protein [Candidatus Saccharimonadales bacterium]|nr:glycosyltransferase family 4 protein [Candidatus Saccharimonadales bacterium]
MKIGLICPYSINKQGGVLEVVLALKDGLQERGHTAKIITPLPRGNNVEHPDDIIFFGTSTDFRSASHTTAQISSTADNKEIDAILEKEQFDILHFHEPWIPFLSRQLLQRSSSINIATFHAKVPESLVSRSVIKAVTPYLKSVMKYLHVYTAVSESGAEYVAGLTKEPITIIPNGINLQKYRKARKKKHPADEGTILFIGRLERRKGVKHLLTAFQILTQENPHLKLVIAGDGPDREKLELLTEDLKIPNVSFLGYISEDLKLKLLSEADLLCSPALFGESFGIVLLEAMATGTMTVAGNNSGYIDVMQGLGAISLVNPEDTAEFARRLDMLLHEPALRTLWQQWAAGHVKQFDNKLVIDQYEELYKEVLKQHGRSAKT